MPVSVYGCVMQVEGHQHECASAPWVLCDVTLSSILKSQEDLQKHFARHERNSCL